MSLKGPKVEATIRATLNTMNVDERRSSLGILLEAAADELRRVQDIRRTADQKIADLITGNVPEATRAEKLRALQDTLDRIQYP
jgi:ribosome recycling factor